MKINNSAFKGLPTIPQYRNWSKEKVKHLVVGNPELEEYVTVEPKYCLNKNTIILYNFSDKPLVGIYKSVIFDIEKGIVLSQRSPRQIAQDFVKNILISGLSFSKALMKELGIKYHHVISLGHTAYFSLKGYTQVQTDWAGLHHIADYRPTAKGLVITSTKINNYQYNFIFCDHAAQIMTRLRESLYHNAVTHELLHEYLFELGLNNCGISKESILHEDEFDGRRAKIGVQYHNLTKDIIANWHYKFGQRLAQEYDLIMLLADLRMLYSLAQRGRYFH